MSAIGHSHQLFHVCVILATHMQMEAILLDKTLRKEWLLANSRVLSFPQIAGATLLCLIFSLSNIIYFSASLYRIPEPGFTAHLPALAGSALEPASLVSRGRSLRLTVLVRPPSGAQRPARASGQRGVGCHEASED